MLGDCARLVNDPGRPRKTNLRQDLEKIPRDLPNAVPPSPERQGALGHLPSFHLSLTPKKSLMSNSDDDYILVLASEPALCHVLPHHEALPSP